MSDLRKGCFGATLLLVITEYGSTGPLNVVKFPDHATSQLSIMATGFILAVMLFGKGRAA